MIRATILLLAMAVTLGCVPKVESVDPPNNVSGEVVYDGNSWKTIIQDSCLSFFDGCNNCIRSSAGSTAACTRKACFKYKKPICLDEAQ